MWTECNVMPIDLGSHHCLKSSGFVHASKTRCAGPLNVRVTTISRSEVRSTLTGFGPTFGSLRVVSIHLLLPVKFFDHVIQRAEARVPQLLVPLDPPRYVLKTGHADPARAHPPNLLGGDE